MSYELAVIFLLPLAGALTAWLVARSRPLLVAVSVLTSFGLLSISLRILQGAVAGERWVHAFGGWGSPFGIVFATDRLTSTFLVLTSVLLCIALWRLLARREADLAPRVVPLLFVLSAGLTGAFLTTDLFNLFVMFELVLLSSYLLLQAPSSALSVRRAFPVVALNLVASLFFFVGVAVLYAAAGTVSLAELAQAIPEADPTLVRTGGVFLLLAFMTKAALVPFLAWLPWSYPLLDGPVLVFFSGLMTKLGVYALLRTVPLLFADVWLPQALVAVGAASAFLGVLAALAQYDLRRLLGFHIVSQVGYMVLGLGLSSLLGLAGAIFYLIHHVLVKAGLFLLADELETRSGETDLRSIRSALGNRKGVALAATFLLLGLSLSGIPPFSGFIAKVVLFRAALDVGSWVLVGVLLVASLGTLASMLKIWRYVFADGPDLDPGDVEEKKGAAARTLPSVALLALLAMTLGVALFAGVIWDHAVETASQLQNVEEYVRAVSSAGTRGLSVNGEWQR